MSTDSVIKYCGCKSNSKGNQAGAQYQNAKLGDGMRYYTGGPTAKIIRCTVCSKLIKVG